MDQIVTYFGLQEIVCCSIEDNNVLLVIHTTSTERGQTYKMLPGLLSQIDKKSMSWCTQ